MSGTVPMFPEIGVLALVPDAWGELWQVRENILSRLAQYFTVLWMNPAREWREILAARGTTNLLVSKPVPPPGLIIYEPEPWLPKLYRPEWLAKICFHQRIERARRNLIEAGCKRIVLYIWRPEYIDALESIPFDFACYHIDDEYSFSDLESPIDCSEAQLIAAVNHVFIHSPGMLEKKGKINPNTTLVPNGVDYKAFATPVAQPPELSTIPHPRIGYAGWLKNQLDWRLLRFLAQQHSNWSLVFVGGHNPCHIEIGGNIAELSVLSNVHVLGPKSTEELCRYPQHFDVCIMPYIANDYTKYIYPLKLHEYLACGRPVVGTRIRSLEDFSDVVNLASSPGEWSTAIDSALSPAANSRGNCEARRAVARGHDWNILVEKIAHVFARGLGGDFAID